MTPKEYEELRLRFALAAFTGVMSRWPYMEGNLVNTVMKLTQEMTDRGVEHK